MGSGSAHGRETSPGGWGVELRKFSPGCYLFTAEKADLRFSHGRPSQQLLSRCVSVARDEAISSDRPRCVRCVQRRLSNAKRIRSTWSWRQSVAGRWLIGSGTSRSSTWPRYSADYERPTATRRSWPCTSASTTETPSLTASWYRHVLTS